MNTLTADDFLTILSSPRNPRHNYLGQVILAVADHLGVAHADVLAALPETDD